MTNLGKCEVNPIKVDGLADVKWMDGKRGAELACLGLRIDERESNNAIPILMIGVKLVPLVIFIFYIFANSHNHLEFLAHNLSYTLFFIMV